MIGSFCKFYNNLSTLFLLYRSRFRCYITFADRKNGSYSRQETEVDLKIECQQEISPQDDLNIKTTEFQDKLFKVKIRYHLHLSRPIIGIQLNIDSV